MKMETSPLLVYLLICFLLLQTYVSSLVLKGVHPHANVRMQFGAEHSPAPFSANAKESAKIDGETHLGIEVPRSGDHHNILLHKVGTYLAVVMKALAKTVEPPQILDGSSTHLDFHVDAEFREPQAHVTITEKHPAEIVLQTLWTGDPQSSDTEITDLSSDLNGLIANSEHFGNAQGTRPTTNGILSILNLSPLVIPHGLPLQGNFYFNLYPSNTGISENDPINSIGGSSINLNSSNQITGTIEQSIQKGIEGPLSNIVESETDKKLSQNTDTENDYFRLNEVNSDQETGNPQKVTLPINVGTISVPNDLIFGLITPTLGGVLPSSGNILLLNISMPLSEISSVFTNETPFPGETQDFTNPLHHFNLPSITNILESNSDGIDYPLSNVLRTILANQIFGKGKTNSDPVSTLTDAFNSLLGEQVNSNMPFDTNLHEAETEIIKYPVPNVFPAAIDTESTTFHQMLTNPNAINPLIDNLDIMEPTFRGQTNIPVPCNTNLRDEYIDLVSKIRRDDTRNQYAGIGNIRSDKIAPTSITVNKEIPAPNVSRSSIAEQTKYVSSNSNLNRANAGRINDPKFYSDSVNQNVHAVNGLFESVDSNKTDPGFVSESGNNLVNQTSELSSGAPLQLNETVHLSFHPNENNGISDIHLHTSSISSSVPAKSELIENMKTISDYPNYGLSHLELNKSNTIFQSRISADEKDNVSHGSHKYSHPVFTTSKHKLNEHKMYHTPDPFSKHTNYKYNMHDRDRSLGEKLENIQKSYSLTDQNYFSEVRSNEVSSGSSHNQIFDKARSLPIEDIVHPFSHNETYSKKLNLEKTHLLIHDSVLSNNLGNKSVHKTEDAIPNKISKNVTASDITSVQITYLLQNDKENDRLLNGSENISNLGNILHSGSGYPIENSIDPMSRNENLTSFYNDEFANENIKGASTILQAFTAHKSQNKIDDVNDYDKMDATEKKIEQLTSANNKNESDYAKIIYNFQNNTPLLYSIATDDTVSNITNNNNYANKILSSTALTESNSEFFAPYVNNSNENNKIYSTNLNTPEENLTVVSNRNSMSEDLKEGIVASENGNHGINGSDYDDLTLVTAHTDTFNDRTDRTLIMRNNEPPTPVPYYTTVLEDIDVDELPERIFDINQFPYYNIIEQGNMIPDNDYTAAPDDSYFREGRKNVENAGIEYKYDKPHSTYILESIPQEYSTPSYQGKYIHQDLQYVTTPSSTYENNGYQVLPEQNIQGSHQSLIYTHSEIPNYQHINLDIIQNNMYKPINQTQPKSDIHHNANFLKNINNYLLPSPSTSYPETTVLTYSHLDELPTLYETHATLEKENQTIEYNSQPIYNFQEYKLSDDIQPYKSYITVQDDEIISPSSVETRFDSVYDLDKRSGTQNQDNYEATNINNIPYDSNKESDSRNEIEQIIHKNYKPAIQLDTGFIPSHNEVIYVIQPNSIDDLRKNISNSEFIVPEKNEVSIHKTLHLQPDSKYFEDKYSSNLSPVEFHSQAIPDLHIESHIQERNFDGKSLQNTIHTPVSSNNPLNTQLQILEVNPYIPSDYKNVLPEESYTDYEHPQTQREIRVHNIGKPDEPRNGNGDTEKIYQFDTHPVTSTYGITNSDDFSSPKVNSQAYELNADQHSSNYHEIKYYQPEDVYIGRNHGIQSQTTLNSTLEQKPSNAYVSRGLVKSELDHKSIYPDEQLVPKYSEAKSSSSQYAKIKNTDEPRSGNGDTEKIYQFDTHPVISTYGITNSDDFSSPKVNSQAYELNSDQHSSNYHEIKYYQPEDVHIDRNHVSDIPEFYHSENEPYEVKTISTTMLPDENTKSSIYEYNIFDNSPLNKDPNSRLHTFQSDSVSNMYGLKNVKTTYPTDRETTYQNYDLQFTEKSYPLSENKDSTMSRYEPKTSMIKLFPKPEKFVKKLHDRITLEKPQSSENEYKLKLYDNETPSKSYLEHESRQTQLYEENNSLVTDYSINYPVYENKPFTNLHSSKDHITSELNLKNFPGNAYLLEDSPINPIYEKTTSMPLISSSESPKSQIYEDKIPDKLYYSNDVSSFPSHEHKKSGVIVNIDQNPLSYFRENKIPEKILNSNSLRFEKQPSAVILEETPISQIYVDKYPGKVYASESPIPISPMSTQNEINIYDYVPQNNYKSGFSQLSTFHDTQTSRIPTQSNKISQSQEMNTPEIRASTAFETHDLKSPRKLYHSSDNGKISSLSNEHLNPTFYENKLLSNSNNFKHTFEDKEKQKFIQDTNYPPSSPYNEIVNETHLQYSIQPVDLNPFESETKKEDNTNSSSHNKNISPSETQGNLQLTYQNYPVSSYYIIESIPISSKDSSVQHQLEYGVPSANSKIPSGLDENSDPNVNKSTPQPGQVRVQEHDSSAVAPYPYYAGDETMKSRIICLTEQRDNIEILRSLKDDISKLKQKLNCE